MEQSSTRSRARRAGRPSISSGVEKIELRNSRESVADRVRTMIFHGHLRPGDRLTQDELAEALGVSRIPVREALVALAREGWVSIAPHKGATVSSFDRDTLRDQFQLVGFAYSLAARRLARSPSPELAAQLQALANELLESSDPADVHSCQLRLRQAVMAAASPQVRSIHEHLSSFTSSEHFAMIPGSSDVLKRRVAQLVKAIVKGDEERVVSICLKVASEECELLIGYLEAKGVFE